MAHSVFAYSVEKRVVFKKHKCAKRHLRSTANSPLHVDSDLCRHRRVLRGFNVKMENFLLGCRLQVGPVKFYDHLLGFFAAPVAELAVVLASGFIASDQPQISSRE